jgi:hypothetical protein
VEIAMRQSRIAVAFLAAFAISGCSLVEATDDYGNTYGDFFNYGNQYHWQLATCQKEVAADAVAEPLRKRYMQCCMWRHGVPIDDSNGCEAPPYSG